MLFIYNEVKTPWELSKNINYLTLRKYTEDVNPRNARFKGKKTKRVTGMLFNQTLVPQLSDVQAQLKKIKASREIHKFETVPASILFGSRTLSPILMPLENQKKNSPARAEKHIFGAAIKIGRKKIISIKTKRAYLLNYVVQGEDFVFISSLNEANASITIRLVDKKAKRIVVRKFSFDGTNLVEKPMPLATATPEQLNSEYRIRRFRPAKPTEAVLLMSEQIDTAKELITEKSKANHNFHSIDTTEQFTSTIDELKEKKYEAVTLYVPGIADVKKTTKTLKEKFYIVHHLLADGTIVKQY